MALTMIDDSQRKAAKAAGWSYLATFVIVVYVNFAILGRLIVSNAAETARNILAHERLFRVGITGDIVYCVGLVVLLTASYMILRPVSPGLALLAAFWRLVWVLTWLAVTLKLFEALRLLSGADYLRVLEPERLNPNSASFTRLGLKMCSSSRAPLIGFDTCCCRSVAETENGCVSADRS